MTDSHPPAKRDRRLLRWLLLGLVLLFGGMYVAAYLFTGERIARGTTIAGVDVGGQTRAGAEAALAELAAPDQRLTLTADGRSIRVRPADAGLTVDVEATVEQVAVGRSWSPARMWEFLTGGSEYDTVDAVDVTKLDAALVRLAEQVSEPPRDGGIRFTRAGKVQADYPEPGLALDTDAGRERILEAFPEQVGDPIEIPVVEAAPALTQAEVSRAMEEFANPAMSAPVVFRIAGKRVSIAPAQYASALSMKIVGDRLEPALRPKRLLSVVEPAMESVALDPEDATVRIVDGRPQVVPGKPGVTFDPDVVVERFLEVVAGEGKGRVLRVPTKIQAPDYSAEEIRKLGIKEEVSSFSTYFPHAEYRNVNIGRAAELIDGTILKPGDVFSLNSIVGERTAENGFVRGFIISDGVFRQDYGGGVSQVATTTFNAAFFAGLKDIEHKPHSFYISRYPVGREATVAWPTVDLRFENDTPYGILIQAWREPSTPSTQGSMNVRMWSTKYWDIRAGQSARYNFTSHKVRHLPPENCEPNSGYGGFDIDVYRYFYKPGSDRRVRTETFHTRYTPSDTVICDG